MNRQNNGRKRSVIFLSSLNKVDSYLGSGLKAKYFTESRLLQRSVRVVILSLPAPTATPFQQTANGSATPAPASLFIGNGKYLSFEKLVLPLPSFDLSSI